MGIVTYRTEIDDLPKRMTPAGANMDREVMLKWMVRGMENSVDIIEEVWRGLAEPHRDTGEYDASMHTLVSVAGDSVQGDVWNDAPHADILELGSGLYRHGAGNRGMIRPRRAKVLAFDSKKLGRTIFTRSVRGQRPKWFGRNARIASRLKVKIAQQSAARMAAREMRASL